MDTQDIIPAATTPATTSPAEITLPSGFQIHEIDGKFEGKPEPKLPTAPPPPPLGVLTNFTGNFAGTGFNTIFRPNSTPTTTNVLELNLTTETLSFSSSIGSVPNRGLSPQNDIFLNGVPYVQAISDVTNTATGKADGTLTGLHFEPGLWMHVPATTVDPVLGESLARMASIPHGTTINAQCLEPTTNIAGPPTIPPVDITPFVDFIGTPVAFPSQIASNTNTPRLPQDLTKFIAAGTITQDILTDPNTVLRNANVGKTITNTITFTVSTTPVSPESGGGTANIAFLGGTFLNPNADAIQMTATFWIETVQHEIVIPIFKPGQPPLKIPAPAPHPGAQVPVFVINPPIEITAPRTIVVTSTQIQYSQKVLLSFADLTWPHVSVATLIPTTEQVPSIVWN
jgi:hypothetical protein